MTGRWRFGEHPVLILTVILFCVYQYCGFCFSLNYEGMALLKIREKVESDPFGALSNWVDENGINDPCFWSGVECDCGNVVALKLEDLCLEGTLASDLGNLVHIKSLLLRNNSLRGNIPNEIRELKELEVLDLGYNNFSGSIPNDLGNNLSLAILLLDHNDFLSTTSPEIDELKRISAIVKRSPSTKRSILCTFPQIIDANRKLLQNPVIDFRKIKPPPLPVTQSISPSPSSSPSPSPLPSPSPSPSPSNHPNISVNNHKNNNNQALVLAAAIGAPLLLLVIFTIFFFGKGGKIASVRPWSTGLSGQLQKVFITGVPKLKRVELEAACEDFSNVIGSASSGSLYKGTLSNGVEIAVASVAVGTAKDWSQNMETQFRKKIDTLSKVNHKNFGNLLGFCVENEPFTRMLVFEYAPNGTLFEHLHKAEHLDWGMRLRIIMGMAYCLDYMHNLTPPISHKNLISSSINLTEDYAAKVSDFSFWSEIAAAEMETNPENNVYDFGVLLFEIITGRLPYSDGGPLEDWASDFMKGNKQPLREIVDCTLQSFEAEKLELFGEVIRSCVYHEPRLRPKMRQVTSRLREITNIRPNDATPKLSPLWWAELEILSTEAN